MKLLRAFFSAPVWKRILSLTMAALLLFSASMVGDLFRIRREAMAYRKELGLTAESAKWDRELVSLSKHVDAGEYQQALSDMDSALKKGADQEAGMWIKRAAILVLLDRSDEALKSLDQADALDDSHSEAALIRAQIYTARNENIPASTVLENFLRRYPDDVACSAALGEIEYNDGDYQKALPLYRTALRDPSDSNYDPEYYLNCAACEMLLGDYSTAVADCKYYRGRSQNGEKTGSSYYLQGVCEMGLEQYQPALDSFGRAADKEFKPVACKEQATMCHYRMGDTKTALAMGEELLDAGSEGGADSSVYETLGIYLLSDQQYADALPFFLRAFRFGRSGTQGGEEAYYIGVCYLAMNQYKDAVDYLSQALNDGADEQLCRYNRGVCYANLKQYQEALEDLRLAGTMVADAQVSAQAKALSSQLEHYL